MTEPHHMTITIIGTASPAMTLRHGNIGTSILLESDRRKIAFDLGPGATSQLNHLGIDIRDVDRIYLTHHHWDHISDLPHFVLGRWEKSLFGSTEARGYASDLTITGPRDTSQLIDRLFGSSGAFANCIATRYAEDIGLPLYGTRGIKPPLPPLVGAVRDISAGDRWVEGDMTFTTSKALHCQPYLESIAYRVERAGQAFVFTGDTAPCEDIISLARDAAVLLHDCNVSPQVRAALGAVTIHSTAEEVGIVAREAGVETVVAVHHGIPVGEPVPREELKTRIASTFAGRIIVASEGDRIEI